MTSTEAMIYQLKQLKGKPLKQKVEHIVTYFWMPIVITLAILIGTVSYIVHLATLKDTALSVICLNTYGDNALANEYVTGFAQNAGIDLEEYEVYISTDLTLGEQDLESAYNTAQVIMAQVASHSVDMLAGDLETATRYFYQDMFYELDQILSAEQKERYAEYFLYADMAVVRQLQEELIESPVFPDPTKPEEMTEPVAVAIRVPAESGFKKNCYTYWKTDIALGIVATAPNIENVLAFLDYIME